MKKRLLKFALVGGMITTLSYFPYPSSAQLFASVQTRNKAEKSEAAPDKMKLRDAILALKSQYNVDILFEEKVLANINVLAENVRTNKGIENTLESILSPNGLKFKKVRKNTYLIVGKKSDLSVLGNGEESNKALTTNSSTNENVKENSNLQAQATLDQTVKGKIVDDKGEGLPGATITLKGTARGVTTNQSGEYTISIPNGQAVLVVSFIGYNTQEFTVGSRNTINIVLTEDLKALNEVVVIGYGTQRKKDLTGAITTINSEDFVKGNVSTPEQMVTGKITSNGGAPGSGSTIRIRGGSSLNASNDPLIVIDGVPVDNTAINGSANALSFINPNDIESFTVLKDASATAIYGSRASNGVIIITTKKGKQGDALRVNISSQISSASRVKSISTLSADEFTSLVNSRGTAAQKALLGTSNTNWQDVIFRNAISYDNNVSVTGSAGSIPFRVSFGNFNQDGILKTSNMSRNSGSIGLSPKFLNNHLRVDLNLKGVITKNRFGDDGAIGAAIGFDPTQPVYSNSEKFGGYFEWIDPASKNPNTLAARNPLALLELKTDNSTVKRSIGNLQLDYKFHFLEDLRANANIGYDISSSEGATAVPAFAASVFTRGGQNKVYSQNKSNKLFEFYLNYVKDLKSIDSKIDVLAGYSYQDFMRDETSLDKTITDNREISNTYFKTQNTLVSFYGRANYTYKDRYLLTFTLRDDGSSRFAANNRWGLFPSAAFAWKINEEEFMKDSKTFASLKLRAGYGITGQQDVGSDYPYLARYTPSDVTSQYQFGTGYTTTLRAEGYDANIKWEQTATANVGLDFGFKRGRISGSIDYYQKKTKDLLSEIPVPAGANLTNRILTNVGNIENQGVEFTLNTTPVISKDFSWDLGFNVTYNKNTITNLTKVADPTFPGVEVGGITGGVGNNVQIHTVGYPTFSYFVYKQVYNEQGQPLEGVYADLNGDGKITPEDRYRYQAPQAKVFLGFNSRFNYKNINLGFVMRANLGNYMYNNVSSNNGAYRNAFNPNNYLSNVSSSVLQTQFNNNQYFSDFYIENASFLRMDNLSLGYNFKNAFRKNINIGLSAIVQNVFVVTKYKGLDPEVQSGIDDKIYPRPRTITFGVNVGF
jgi:TonB-dependent starch-binding outer membrane protein SusC